MVIFRDLVKCAGRDNPPNNHVFVLDQSHISPCQYGCVQTVAFTEWAVSWLASHSLLKLADTDIPPHTYFESRRDGVQYRFWQSSTSCPADGACGGTGIVVPVNNSLCQIIAQLYGLNPTSPSAYDSHSEDIDHTRFSLSVRGDRTRCKIQIDDEFVDFGWPLA